MSFGISVASEKGMNGMFLSDFARCQRCFDGENHPRGFSLYFGRSIRVINFLLIRMSDYEADLATACQRSYALRRLMLGRVLGVKGTSVEKIVNPARVNNHTTQGYALHGSIPWRLKFRVAGLQGAKPEVNRESVLSAVRLTRALRRILFGSLTSEESGNLHVSD